MKRVTEQLERGPVDEQPVTLAEPGMVPVIAATAPLQQTA
jgi:hypothetical protein